MRSAMNGSASGLMARSCSATWYQQPLVFHPAAVHVPDRPAAASGRWVAAITDARSTGTSAQQVSRDSE